MHRLRCCGDGLACPITRREKALRVSLSRACAVKLARAPGR